MKTLVVGGSGFIGSYLMREIEADNLDLVEGRDAREKLPSGYEVIIFLACNQENTKEAYQDNWEMYEVLNNYRKRFSEEPYLIYISSAAIYNLNSWYALSKKLGEAYAKRFEKYSILRLSNVYGHGEGHGAPDRFMRGEKTIHGDGFQIRDLIPVEDVVSAILNMLKHPKYGVFNISSGKGIDVNDMFKLFGSGQPEYDDEPTGVKESVLRPGAIEW